MKAISNIISGNNPLVQMKQMTGTMDSPRMGDPVIAPDIVFNPSQLLNNQMNTSAQVQNYASSKAMAEQGRSDMRGNVIGYSDTLG
jgi:hypothetical protein